MSLGGPEILVIIVVALLVLGPDKLPTVMKTLGKTFAEFKKYQDMAKSEIDKAIATATAEDESSAKPDTEIKLVKAEVKKLSEDSTKTIKKVKPIIDDDES